MANEADSNTPPLTPLEYCSPERAARLLGCEVEDIFHWASIGAITIYAEFLSSLYSDGENFLINSLYIHEDLYIPQEYKIVEYVLDGVLKEKKIPVGDSPPIVKNDEVLYSSSKWFKHGASLYTEQPSKHVEEQTVAIFGFWAIDTFSFSLRRVPLQPEKEVRWNLKAIYLGDDSLKGNQTGIELYDVIIEDMPLRMRVMHEDLLKIQEHMISGKLMNKKPSMPRPENCISPISEPSPHPTAERYAATREKIYAAAIYAREQWPEECLNATAWAATIDNHSHHLFDLKEGEKSPSQEMMARMLSKAMNKGVPYKKS